MQVQGFLYFPAMSYFLNGIAMGLALSLLAGPLLFALVQSSLERGLRAGLAVGAGIWVSDLLFIAASYLGLSWLVRATQWAAFEEALGTGGGLFLIAVGAATALKTSPAPEGKPLMGNRTGNLGAMWMKGFLINTINPFTVFFWTSVATGLLLEDGEESWLFYPGVMLTIIATDSFKVFAAKAIRLRLKPGSLLILRRISGLALLAFGVALIVRVWFLG
jgi:threonine/homoserine/homoserine lactone efflux protein